MIPDEIPSLKGFLEQVKETHDFLRQKRNFHLSKIQDFAEKSIGKEFPRNSPMYACLLELIRSAWEQGYNNGIEVVSDILIKEMNLKDSGNPVITDQEKYIQAFKRQLDITNPENN